MFSVKPFAFILLIFFSQLIFAQEKKQAGKLQSEYSIPFHLTEYNNLSVQAILNRKDTVQLMFHTAANDLTLTEEAVQKLKTIHFNDNTDSIKSWGGSVNSSRLSKNNAVQIAGLTWENVPIWENKNSGQHTDGKFGIDLFTNKVIEIDFDKMMIRIYTKLPAKSKQYGKLALSFENDDMFIDLGFKMGDTTLHNKFLIHSGYAGGLLFDDKFANENRLGEKLKIVGEKSLKDSYGNILKTKKAIMPLVKIGNEQLTDVPVGFFEGAIGRQKMSILGGDILKRFNLIIDAERKFIYLKSNGLATLDYFNL
jgi:hypothetical protein